MRRLKYTTIVDPASRFQPASIVIAAGVLCAAFSSKLCLGAPVGDAYCGIHSIFAALRLQGSDVTLDELVQAKYIGSRKGSTLGELQQAVTDHHFYAMPLGNLTTTALRASSHPIVLHVMGSNRRRSYDHWLLFIRPASGGALIYDAPGPPSVVSWRYIAMRWDGTGLAVSASPIDPAQMRRSSYQWLLLFIAIGVVIAMLGAFQIVKPRQPSNQRITISTLARAGVVELGVLVGIAMIGGLLTHTVGDEGILARGDGSTPASDAFATRWMPRVGVSEVKSTISRPASESLIIDARYVADYLNGHIPRAINIPVDCDESGIDDALRGIDRRTKIIVYCQSTACDFDETIASAIQQRGFHDIAIFHDGWLGWQDALRKQSQ